MGLFDKFKWKGSGRVYSLPWIKNRLEYSSDPERISEYAKCPFTRSRFVREMLTQFHLSRDSIVVSDDSHAKWLKLISKVHLPTEKAIPEIAKQVVEGVFVAPSSGGKQQSIHISDMLIRELYQSMLSDVLKVEIGKPLEDYIFRTKFPHGSRPMVLEGIMYSFRLHTPLLRPILYVLDHTMFKRTMYMKRISRKLEQMVFDYTTPKPDSWFSTLAKLKEEGRITETQFRGEITSMLVSSFSLASALGSALLCLAARPRYQKRIRNDPKFARYFTMEVLRLYPPFRQFGYEKEDSKKGSFLLGQTSHEFMVAVHALHRNSEYWVAPHKFYPERFMERGAMAGLKYIPFGMGKRSCPGRRFSMSLIVHALQFICSDESKIASLKRDKLPKGMSGRLISFAVDDTLSYSMKQKREIQEVRIHAGSCH